MVPNKRKHLPYWRQFFWDLVGYPWFNNLVLAFIITNTITMSMTYYGESNTYSAVLESINMVLSVGFILEFIFKHM